MINFKELANLTASIHHKSKKMQVQLILYWCTMAFVLFGILLTVFSITGVFSNTEKEAGLALEAGENTNHAIFADHLDSLEAQAIALSEQASKIIEDTLFLEPITSLSNHPQDLLELQRKLYTPLWITLQTSRCSGAFLVLNTTINTEAASADHSRSGLYLRLANPGAVQSATQNVAYFRGIPDIAREIPLELHNRWNLEFDIDQLTVFDKLMKREPQRLASSCLWSRRKQLTDTWEDVVLLAVPIYDKIGGISGICGIEVSSLYFHLAYPSLKNEFGSMISLLAPLDGEKLLVEDGLVGGLDGVHIEGMENLTIKKGRHFNTYQCDEGTYIGVHRLLDIDSALGLPIAAVTLLPRESYISSAASERITMTVGTLAFLLIMILMALFLSNRFVKPIKLVLNAIRSNTWGQQKKESFLEIDDLFDFLAQKDREYEEVLHTLEQEKQEAQDEADRVQAELSKAQSEYERTQTEISRLQYSRKKEIDPKDYQNFLDGLNTLTPTERTIFGYYLDGKNVKEIMEIAGIKESTIRYHNRNIYSKLGVNSLKQMLRYAALNKRQAEGENQ